MRIGQAAAGWSPPPSRGRSGGGFQSEKSPAFQVVHASQSPPPQPSPSRGEGACRGVHGLLATCITPLRGRDRIRASRAAWRIWGVRDEQMAETTEKAAATFTPDWCFQEPVDWRDTDLDEKTLLEWFHL